MVCCQLQLLCSSRGRTFLQRRRCSLTTKTRMLVRKQHKLTSIGFHSSRAALALADINFEKINVLFCLGALQSCIGAISNYNSDEGLKTANKSFQVSSICHPCHVISPTPVLGTCSQQPRRSAQRHQRCTSTTRNLLATTSTRPYSTPCSS